jgi:hypothetical protein
MPFPKPPHLLSAEELADSVRLMINEKWPESDTLDYKAALNYSAQKDRIELAKDISSFANEVGGTIIYGVPETTGQEVPLPAALDQCGLEVSPGVLERVENILLDGVTPILPNLLIKPVSLPEIEPKKLVVIHHPASWNRPHMVELDEHRRFYRRGNYRAISMREREVEAAFASRRSHNRAAEDFLRVADLGNIPSKAVLLRVTGFPVLGIVRREKMREDAFRQWIDRNAPADRRGDWVPFLDGVRFLSYAGGPLDGHQFELRLFHNGALSFTTDMTYCLVDGSINLALVKKVIELYFLVPLAKAIEFLGIAGPVMIELAVFGAVGFKALFKGENREWFADPEKGPSALSFDPSAFREESAVEEILGQPQQLLSRLLDRLASAFGMWPLPR